MSAQEEFNQLMNNNRHKFSSHPEDHQHHDRSSSPDFSDSSQPRNLRQRRVLDSEDEDENPDEMISSRSNYQIPNTVFDANTGPKGVIADAQAFERARKKSFRRTLLNAAGFNGNDSSFGKTRDDTPIKPTDSSSGSEDDEERFLRKWRVSRMQELQSRGMRRPSPRGRRWGAVETVDAAGYLDAIEKVTPDTVVVVCIYNPSVCTMIRCFEIALSNLSVLFFLLSSPMTVPLSRNALSPLPVVNPVSVSSSCTRRLPRWITSRLLLCWHIAMAMSSPPLSTSFATSPRAAAAVPIAWRTC